VSDAMDTKELAAALRGATEAVDTRSGFIGDVLNGARRRQVRRRNGAALVIAAVVGVAGFGVGATFRNLSNPPVEVADSRLLEPTKGDLAGDRERLEVAATAWQDATTTSWKYDRAVGELRGKPHVYWAGTTQEGPAAVVMQEAKITDTPGWRTLIGLVATDPADGKTKVVGSPMALRDLADAFQFGPNDRTLLVVTRDTPVFVSVGVSWSPDGLVVRQWERLTVTDGVGVLTRHGGTGPNEVRLVTSAGSPTVTKAAGELYPVVASAYVASGGRTDRPTTSSPSTGLLPWEGTGNRRLQMEIGAPPEPPLPADVVPSVVSALKSGGVLDVGTASTIANWSVVGGLPDGRSVVVVEFKEEARPSRIAVVLYGADGKVERTSSKPTDLTSALPVMIRMPDGQGWVVAAWRATLKYRTEVGGAWQTVSDNAALLPDDAVQVEVGGVGQVAPAGHQVVDLVG